ncbi:MAG TPA: hypothetical protein VF077_12995 [Nitrospiraceae bacterium]
MPTYPQFQQSPNLGNLFNYLRSITAVQNQRPAPQPAAPVYTTGASAQWGGPYAMQQAQMQQAGPGSGGVYNTARPATAFDFANWGQDPTKTYSAGYVPNLQNASSLSSQGTSTPSTGPDSIYRGGPMRGPSYGANRGPATPAMGNAWWGGNKPSGTPMQSSGQGNLGPSVAAPYAGQYKGFGGMYS